MRTVLFAAVSLLIFFSVQAAVYDEAPNQPAADPVAGCMPADIGEKSILWLESDRQGGMVLRCEKHAALGYGMAQIPVTVSVE